MIGIDIGGANLKVVSVDRVCIHYCPLWEHAPVSTLLEQYATRPGEQPAVVMSGELADCFETKRDGISFIVNAVRDAFPSARFYGTDGRFHDGAVPQLAAANWLASADYLRVKYPDAVLLDIGSTTADIIPLGCFESLLGLTDLLRLQKGYLVYTGMLRGNIATLLQSVVLDAKPTPLSSEYFATSADVHLVLGHITPAQYNCDTPDKKERTAKAAHRRLARVVCADLDEIGTDGTYQIAAQFWEKQKSLVCDQVRRVVGEAGARQILVAGIGAPLFARELEGLDLNDELGPYADALPAFAVREIAVREKPGLI
jgi:probable H4MPT-linked C1 transfer pathway protein